MLVVRLDSTTTMAEGGVGVGVEEGGGRALAGVEAGEDLFRS